MSQSENKKTINYIYLSYYLIIEKSMLENFKN